MSKRLRSNDEMMQTTSSKRHHMLPLLKSLFAAKDEQLRGIHTNFLESDVAKTFPRDLFELTQGYLPQESKCMNCDHILDNDEEEEEEKISYRHIPCIWECILRNFPTHTVLIENGVEKLIPFKLTFENHGARALIDYDEKHGDFEIIFISSDGEWARISEDDLLDFLNNAEGEVKITIYLEGRPETTRFLFENAPKGYGKTFWDKFIKFSNIVNDDLQELTISE